jgi:glucose/arabinose dehydrogenase
MLTRFSIAAVVVLSVFLPFVSSGTGSDSTPPTQVRLTQIQAGFSAITDLQHAGDARLFVAQQGGLIHIIKNGSTLGTPFLDISGRLVHGGERGLLGLAFHPQYASNGYFYVNYTYEVTPGGQLRSRVSRFSVSAGNADVADAGSELILLEFNQPFTNHNGGALQFGPDGYLYIASGDGGDSYDPQENSQNTANLLGKVLRIDVNSTAGGSSCNLAANGRYGIPAGNPLADGAGGACDEIWAYGLRNPWRISFDRQTGDLWIADVGQAAREEIDFQAAGSAGGQNYGWDCFEGTVVNNMDRSPLCANNPPVVAPVHEYDHAGGKCSITGGYVYRGPALDGYTGAYFFADYCSDEMWTLRRTGGAPIVTKLTVTLSAGVLNNIRSFGQDATGELYVATGTAVFRVDDPSPAPAAPEGT